MAIPWNIRKYADVIVIYEKEGARYEDTMKINDAIYLAQEEDTILISAVTPKKGDDYTNEILDIAKKGDYGKDLKTYYGIGNKSQEKLEPVKPAVKEQPKPTDEELDVMDLVALIAQKEKEEREEAERKAEEDFLSSLEPESLEPEVDDDTMVFRYRNPITWQEQITLDEDEIPPGAPYEEIRAGDLPYAQNVEALKLRKKRW